MLRLFIERARRQLRFKRRLPVAFGRIPIWVSPSAGLRYLFQPMSDVDPVLLRLVSEFVATDSVVWDVGANVGLFSFTAAFQAGPRGLVLALEPDVRLVQLCAVHLEYSLPLPLRFTWFLWQSPSQLILEPSALHPARVPPTFFLATEQRRLEVRRKSR